jgi:alpha-tubulin suppressor-like RCC1 family protein
VVAIAAGGHHTVALKNDGTVVAWGRNEYGQTTVPAGLSGVVAIAAGSLHTVALKNDGTVVAWGYNFYGQTTVPSGLSGVVAIAAGFYHAVALIALPPSISVQPLSQTVTVGSNMTFAVVSAGSLPFSYQWRSNTVSIANATNSLFSLTNAQLAWSGSRYSVVVTNAYGSVTSAVATLKVEAFGAPQVVVTGTSAGSANSFRDSASVTITTAFTNASIHYSRDGSAPFIGGPLAYSGAFTVMTNTTVRALAVNLNDFSSVAADPVSITIIPTYALTLTTAGGGTVARTPSAGSYLSNSVVTISAVPDAGWTFLGWTGDTNGLGGGAAGSAGATNTVTMSRARSIAAVFGTTLGTSVTGSGTVQLSPASGPYPYGSVVRLTPKPAVGSYFSLWGNAASGSSNPLDFTVTTPNRTVSALFTALGAGQVNLYLDVVGNGSVTRSPSLNAYSSGQTVTLTAVTPPVSLFNGWSGDSTATTNVISLVLDANKLVTASFSPVPVGTVVAWGYNVDGEATVPTGLSGVVVFAAGYNHTVALKSDGTAVGWGRNSNGETSVPAGLGGVVAFAAGEGYTVALNNDGTVVAWGSSSDGQTNVPPSLSGVVAIAAGSAHTVALKNDGTVVAWGRNSEGQTTVPAGLGGVVAVSAKYRHTVALKNDGTVVAWGLNDYGQTTVPAGLIGVVAIVAGGYHTAALKNDGTVVAWGRNSEGQTTVPSGLSGVVAVSAGIDYTVALKNDGTVVAWGYNATGQTAVPAGLSGVVAIAAGGNHTVAVIGDARAPSPPSISIQPLGQTVTAGSNVTFSVAAAGSSPFSYQWRSNTVSIANATNASFTLANVQPSFAASYSVVITNAYGAVTSAPAVLTVKLGQSITFNALTNRTFIDSPFSLSASASSGLPVTFSVVSGPASLAGNVVTLLGTGSVTLRASQAGDATYAVATSVDQTFTVTQANQTITFAPLPDRLLGDPPFSLSATASSGLPVAFSLLSGPASLSGSTLTMTNGGVVTVRAAQAGNTNYNAAPNVDRSFTVSTNTPPVVTLTTPTNGQFYIAPATVSFTATASDTDGAIARTEFYLGTTLIASVTNQPPATPVTNTATATNIAVGSYVASAVAVDADGARATNSVNINVYLPPVIIQQPQSTTNLSGRVAFFSVTATGNALSFQWRKDGTNLIGATNALLLLGNVQTNQAGNYSVVVSNAAGVVTSSDASLIVSPAPSGTVVTWGSNIRGQTSVPAGLSNAVTLAGGYYHSLALRTDGTVVAWGDNSSGQTNVPAGLNGVAAIAAGYADSLALKNNGTVVAWGINDYGQTNVPAGLSGVVSIAAGYYHVLALRNDGTLVGWGYNLDGQATVPAGLSGVVAVAAGFKHSLVLKSDGTVAVWGDGSNGQTNVPPGLNGVVAVAAGDYHSLALKSDGTVIAWGRNAESQTNVPAGLSGAVAVASKERHNVATTINGTVFAWGRNGEGQTIVPAGLSGVTAVAAGGDHSVAISTTEGLPIRILVDGVFVSNGTVERATQASIVFQTSFTNAALYYSLDGSAPFIGGPLTYSGAFTVTSNVTVRALAVDLSSTNFSSVASDPVSITIIPTYALTLSTAGGGTVARTPSAGSYLSNSIVTISAVPDAGWTFLGWTGDTNGLGGGASGSTGATNSVTMSRARSIAAVFGTTLGTSVVGSGTVQLSPASGPYPYGSVVRLTPRPAVGSYFSLWGNAASGSSNPLDFTVTTPNRTVSALFTALGAGQVNVYVDVVGNGTVTRSPALNVYSSGQTVTLTAVLSPVLRFEGWAGDSTATTNVIILVLDANKSVTASFSPVPVGTVVAWGGNGDGQTTVPAGLSGVVAMAGGGVHTVALKNDGTVVAWGLNNQGQTTVPAGLSGVVAIAAGGDHAVALIGDARAPSPPSISVQPLSQAVTAGSNATFTVSAAGSSPFSYQWRSNAVGVADATNALFTLSNVQTSFAASYSVVITNAYGSITSAPAVLTVKLGQSITFNALTNRTFIDSPFSLTASASSGLPVTFSVVSGLASLAGNVVTLLGTGSVTLRASQAGDATYAAAASVDQTFTVAKADQSITFAALPNRLLGDPPFALSATAGSGLPVTFSLVSGPASLSGSTLTMTNGGVVTVRAAQAGNANFNAAPNVDRSFTVFTNPPPAVTLASPAHRQSFKLGVAVALSASAVDPQAEAVTNLTVFANNAPIGSANGGTFTGSWMPPSAGLYTLRAEARDSAGVLGRSSDVEVRVQSLPPSVNLLSPTNGSLFSLPTNIVLQAFAQDTDGFTNLVALVEFLDFGTNVIGSVANPTNTTVAFTWTNPPPGQHSLTARATDAAGFTEESSARTITVTYPADSVPVFSFAQASYSVAENAGSVTLTVVKNPSPAAAVNYTTADGSARAQDGNTPGDYVRQSGALSFAAGQLSTNIVIPIINDAGYEPDQSFIVTLSTADAGVVLTNPFVATVLILDDDPAPTTNSVTTVLNPPALPALNALGALTVSTLCTNLPGVASTNIGQWRLAWDTVWRNSGDALSRLQPGIYEIVFQQRDGFTTPAAMTATVVAGGTATPVAYYSAAGPLQLGHLQVRLTPSTAQWRLQGELPWRTSDTTASNLVAGPYVIEFNDLAGYHRLPPSDVRVYPNHLGVPRYTFPANSATWEMNLVSYAQLETVITGEPHAFNGQLLGEGGYGSGTVVKKRVVLTAAHLVFDDRKLGFVTNVYWFHRRYAGAYEPRPQQPRGWYVFGGYDSQRAVERTPGVSSPASQHLDTAALFFYEDAGGGGQSGYLASDAGTNWLTGGEPKLLTGYPLDFPVPLDRQRKLQSFGPFTAGATLVSGGAHATSAFRSSGGNSGGALNVRFNGTYYPAGVFLGGNNQSIIRTIDRDVVDLINRAELTANTGDNNTSGGVPTDSGPALPVPVGLGVGGLAVRLNADAMGVGGGWRFVRPGGEADPFITDNALTTNRVSGLQTNQIEFASAAGFLTPGRVSAPVLANTTQTLSVVYARTLSNFVPVQVAGEEFRMEVTASSYGRYVVEGLTTLSGYRHLTNAPWVPLATNTLDANGRHVFTNFPGAPYQFFRTVYLGNP